MLLKPVCHSSSVARPSPKRGLCSTSNSRSISVPSHRAHHVGVEGSWPQSRRRAGSGPAPTRELRALDTVVAYICVVGSHRGKCTTFGALALRTSENSVRAKFGRSNSPAVGRLLLWEKREDPPASTTKMH